MPLLWRIAGGDVLSIRIVNLLHGVIQTMSSQSFGITAAVFAGIGTAALSLAVGQSPGVAQRTFPAAPRAVAARWSPAADLIYKYVKKQDGRQLAWQRIPWLVDIPEAIRQSKAENRPVLLWASGNDPLERC